MSSITDRSPPVLIVEDDADTRDLFANALQSAGIDSIVACSGEEALNLLETTRVSLILMDSLMPGRSGLDVLAELKASRGNATIPVILLTESENDQSLVLGLDAGAADFIAKPVRLGLLVARVRAHLRSAEHWESRLHEEILDRARLVKMLSRIRPSGRADETAELIVQELVAQMTPDFVAVLQVSGDQALVPLAAFAVATGIQRGGKPLTPLATRHLLELARSGPWTEVVDTKFFDVRNQSAFALSRPHSVAGAPIYVHDRLVGILTIGAAAVLRAAERARLMASAIDFAVVLSATVGTALEDRQQLSEIQSRLGRVLESKAFSVAFQPIVRLEGRAIVGFEALARFTDGADPSTRFAEVARAGMTRAFEVQLVRAALDQASGLAKDMLLALNVSPTTILFGDLRDVLAKGVRPIVLEVTEHALIPDYQGLRDAIAALGDDVTIAVDDAGAGYASLHHILELKPSFAKLDISIVGGVDRDKLRQAMIAGLVDFGRATGCRLIAEGVETEAEAGALTDLGVELGQGYLFGRAASVPAESLALLGATAEGNAGH